MKTLFFLICIFYFSQANAQKWLWGVQGKASYGIDDEESGFTRDKSGNLYITGYFQDTLIFGTDTLKTGKSFYSAFIAKYDLNGNVLWARQSTGGLSTYNEQIGISITTDKVNNVCITGYFVDTCYFGPYELVTSTNGPTNMFLAKFDSSGNILWAKQSMTSGVGDGEGFSVSTDAKNNIYVTGTLNDSASFGPYTLYGLMFVAKYNSIGNILWAYSPRSADAIPYSIVTDSIGNSYVTGTFGDTLYFGSDTLTGTSEYFLVKFDSSGKVIWARQNINATDARGYAVTLDIAGNVYTTGYYIGTPVFSGTTLTNSNVVNLFLAKYDSYGNKKWVTNAKRLDNCGWTGYAITTDNQYNVYLSGGGNQNTCNVQFGSQIFTIAGVTDPLVLLKYDSSGNAVCGSIIGSGGDDYSGLTVDPSGNYVCIAGDIADTVTFGSNKLGSATANAEWIFLAKWQPCGSNTEELTNIVESTNLNVALYPNPTNGRFTIESSALNIRSLEIYNMFGEMVHEETLKHVQGANTIDLSGKPSGVYLYRVINLDGTPFSSGKFIIQ